MWKAGKGDGPLGPEDRGERALFRELAARREATERAASSAWFGSRNAGRRQNIALVAAAICFGVIVAAFAGGASAVHDLGLFQLDANAVVDASPPGEDWNSVVGDGSGPLPLAGSQAISASFVNDPYNAPNADSVYGAGSSKDIDDVTSWTYTLAGNANDKLDFEHAGAALYVAANGDPILYFFADRYAQNGDAKVGFWFFKGDVGLQPSPGTHFTGAHQNGDVLIESDFTNGGANITNIVVKEWQNGALSNPLGTGADCKTASASDELCGTNSTGTFGQLWSFTPKAQSTAGSFFEGGIDLASLFGGKDNVPCFSSFLAHSRTSGESDDSELKDFVFGDFNTCGTITVVKNATPKDNTPFSFTTTGGPPLGGDFPLTDPGSTTKVFTNVPKGSYSVTESALPNWNLASVDCTSKGAGTSAPAHQSMPAASITMGYGGQVTCVYTNVHEQGYLKVAKAFDPKSSGFAGTFAIKVDCGAAGVQTVSVVAGGSATVGPFDTGTQCSVSEPSLPSAPAGWSFGAAQVSGSPATIVASSQASPGVTVTVTNSITRTTGSLTLSKVMSGGPAGYTGPFTITYDCNDGADHDGSVSLVAGATSAPISGIPTGTQCVISEALPAPPPGYAFQTPTFAPSQTVTIDTSGQTVDVLTTNTLTVVPSPPSSPPAPKADVAIVKDATSQVVLGSNGKASITYDFRILNNGPDPAADVTVADPAPTGVVFDSVSQQPAVGSCTIGDGGALVSCSVGTLASGEAITFRVAATVSVTGTITNTGTTTTSTPDTDSSNNTDSAQTVVVAPLIPPAAKPAPKPTPAAVICRTLVAGPKMLKANGKTQTLKLRVRQGTKGVDAARIKISGPGISKTVRTGVTGLALVSVKPSKPGIIKVAVVGGKACNTQKLGVIGAFEPPVTG
jgi:uncharacterized repeat protein (TIGR01451 family)